MPYGSSSQDTVHDKLPPSHTVEQSITKELLERKPVSPYKFGQKGTGDFEGAVLDFLARKLT